MTKETPRVLDPRRGDTLHSEDNKIRIWFNSFSKLDKNISDFQFREELNEESPDKLWRSRPLILKKLDLVPQYWYHHEEVGRHIYHVLQKLDTSLIKRNGSDIDRVKVVRATALLHDNGKIKDPANSNHPLDSAQEVEKYLSLMGFNNKERELCLHLIANHDLLGKVANPLFTKVTIDDLIKYFPAPEDLECLFAFTIADIGSIIKMTEKIPTILIDITRVYVVARNKLLKEKGNKLFNGR